MRFAPVVSLLLGFAALGCIAPPIGVPCVPETIPENGFLARETYVETNSAQCESRICIARGLSGDPRPGCTEGCTPDNEVQQFVYCTARCESDEECPADFVCEDLGERHGWLCVRDNPVL